MTRPIYVSLQAVLMTAILAWNSGAHGARREEINLREACRKAASGMYLNAWDQMSQTQKLLASIETKKKALDASLTKESKLLAQMRGKVVSSNYDLELAQKIDSKSGLVRTLETQVTEMTATQAKARDDVRDATKTEAATRSAVVSVFDILSEKKARPLRLEYKASCPKYRYLCPLPRDHAIRLRDLAGEKPDLEPCQRYADQSINNKGK